MSSKHPNEYTSQEVYDLTDRLRFAADKCPEFADLLKEGSAVLLNRQTILSQVRILTEGK